LLNSQLKDIKISKKGAKSVIATPSGDISLETEKVLVAIGRVPVTENTGLEELGVKLDRGYVVPSDWATLQTSVPGIYAVGDILPPPSLALAHASFAEGIRVAEALAGIHNVPIDYAGIPRATYSHPEAASVGLSEKQAKELGYEVVTNKVPLTSIAKGLIYGQGGMVKIVAEKNNSGNHEGAGKVLGVHLVGPHATEMISEGMLIYNWEALPMEVAEYIHPHPSLSEAFGEASLTLANRRLHQMGK
jgi:dihydrolipoamide dehydrogenase